MFVVGLDMDSRLYFSAATALIGIPTAIKIFTYMSAWYTAYPLYRTAAQQYFVSFILSFLFGGLSGLLLSSSNLD